MNTDPLLAELQRELAALRERVAALETNRAAGGGAITCSSLTIVDSHNQPVAAIDASGFLQCQRILVAKPGAGTCLAYDPQFAELVIYELNPSGGPLAKLVTMNESGLGRLALKAPAHLQSHSFVKITPDTNGGRLEMGDRSGNTICDGNVGSAGATWFLKANAPHQGSVTLGMVGVGSGEVVVRDANGKITGRLG